MIGLIIGTMLIFAVAWLALDYSLKHDAGIDELGLENNALRERIRQLEAELETYRRMEA